MDDKEDGEISDEGVYQPIERPTAPIYRNAQPMALTDDESSSDDSDAEWKQEKKRMRLAQIPQPKVPPFQRNGAKKRNNIWANVLQEDELTHVIGGVGLKKKLHSDRNVESYDYSISKMRDRKNPFSDGSGDENRETSDMERDAEEDAEKRESRKQRFNIDMDHSGNTIEGLRRKRMLENVAVEPSWTDEELGTSLAQALFEPKTDLMVRIVEVLGREKTMQVYEETKKLEYDGGMLIMNGARRRTSGGVFLHLLKYKSLVTKEQSDKIFLFGGEATEEEKKRKRNAKRRKKRKMEGKQFQPPKITESIADEGLLGSLFGEDPNGTKCPGSTPVESVQNSDSDEGSLSPLSRQRVNSTALPIPFKEVCEKAAQQIVERDHSQIEVDSTAATFVKPVETTDAMDVV